MVAVDGRLQTRQWEDDKKLRHWKTEIVAARVEMLSGRRKKDYAAEAAAEALAAQAQALGFVPTADLGVAEDPDEEPDDDEAEGDEADGVGEALSRSVEAAIA